MWVILILSITSVYSLRFCVNCRYSIISQDAQFSKCSFFPKDVDKVTGAKSDDYSYCDTARNLEHMCGEEGFFFKSRDILQKYKREVDTPPNF